MSQTLDRPADRPADTASDPAQARTEKWLADFTAGLASGSVDELFTTDCYWPT